MEFQQHLSPNYQYYKNTVYFIHGITSNTWKYLQVFEEPIELFFIIIKKNIFNFWLCLGVWDTFKDFVVFFIFFIENIDFANEILPNWILMRHIVIIS